MWWLVPGAKKVLEYQHKVGNKIGLKSTSVVRVTHTYYDVTEKDNVEGMPASVFSFVDKYKRLQWGYEYDVWNDSDDTLLHYQLRGV